MKHIRPARAEDLARIAEIEIFNYRLSFYPIFRYDPFYFRELQVPARMEHYRPALDTLWVYDDGVVKGFFQAENRQLHKLLWQDLCILFHIGHPIPFRYTADK